MIVTACAEMVGRVRSPGQRVDAGLVGRELDGGDTWHTDVNNDGFRRVGEDGSDVVVVETIPGHA